MSLTYYNLSDDWGWYVDIENMKPVYQINPVYTFIQDTKINYHFNNLETNEEDEYEYFINNQKNIVKVEFKHNNNTMTYHSKDILKNIFNIGSTAIITAVFTLILFVIL